VAVGAGEQGDRGLRIQVLAWQRRVVRRLGVRVSLTSHNAAEHAVRHEAPPDAPVIIAPPRSASGKGARMGTCPKCKRKIRKNGNHIKLGSTWYHKACPRRRAAQVKA